MTIEYFIKNVYGQELMYVKDDQISGYIFALTGKKTINGTDIFALEQLGNTFTQVLPPTKN